MYMWRQNILLKPTDTELLEEADCTHKLPGAGPGGLLGFEERDSLWWMDTKPHRAFLPGQGQD